MGRRRPRQYSATAQRLPLRRVAGLLNSDAPPTQHDAAVASVSLDQSAPRHLRTVTLTLNPNQVVGMHPCANPNPNPNPHPHPNPNPNPTPKPKQVQRGELDLELLYAWLG